MKSRFSIIEPITLIPNRARPVPRRGTSPIPVAAAESLLSETGAGIWRRPRSGPGGRPNGKRRSFWLKPFAQKGLQGPGQRPEVFWR